MIRIYFLPVESIAGTEQVAGIDYIHDALLLCNEEPDIRKLIMDTTESEHLALVLAGGISDAATQEDIDLYHAQVVITPPDPDVEEAKTLLATSPPVVTMPEIWELLRIIGHRFGWC